MVLVGSYSLKNSWSHCSAGGCLRLPGVTRGRDGKDEMRMMGGKVLEIQLRRRIGIIIHDTVYYTIVYIFTYIYKCRHN